MNQSTSANRSLGWLCLLLAAVGLPLVPGDGSSLPLAAFRLAAAAEPLAESPAADASPAAADPGTVKDSSAASPAGSDSAAKPPSPAEPVVAATVNERPIHAADVRRQLDTALRGRPVEKSAQAALQAEALAHLIDRRLILLYLERHERGASAAEIQLARARLEKQLQRQERTLDDYLSQQGIDERQLREELSWRIGWPRYLERYLTEENFARYFERHRAEFDGRRLRVAHILFRVGKGGEAPAERPDAAGDSAVSKPDEPATARAIEAASEQARAVRASIVAGEISFADAARRHSQSPSARDGGDLGWIERQQPMPEPFSAAAFALREGEISPPVVSPFGVHLIQCQAIEPGDKSWRDVQEPLRDHMIRYLFEWTASRERPRAAIRFSGAMPYRDPRTGRLVHQEGP